MTCPRCGGDIEEYALSGHDAQICEGCGYVGVSVEHQHEPMEFESWDEALERFYEAQEA